MKVVIGFVTGNENKFNEFKSVLNSEILSTEANLYFQRINLDLPEIQSNDLSEIVQAKLTAAAASERVKGFQQGQNSDAVTIVVVEDTCLGFSALGNLPGPFIKWFLDKIKLTGLIKLLEAFPDKSATAVTTLGALIHDERSKKDRKEIYIGETEGVIAKEPRGSTTFGWDPIFVPRNSDLTYAEMTKEQKNSISHRGKAIRKFVADLKQILLIQK